MDVLFLSPAYPPEMQQFTRGLTEVGARVWGVGDSHPRALPAAVRDRLAGYLHVPAILDEDDVIRRVDAWLAGRRPDRIEGLWEVVTLLPGCASTSASRACRWTRSTASATRSR